MNEERVISRSEIEVEAAVDRLPEVLEFVESRLEEAGCAMKTQMQITVSAEEIFVNIASYAYAPESGRARISLEMSREPKQATIIFTDSGRPFDPTAREDPDVTLQAENREIGGLGIFMTKKFMDDVRYEYRDGQNVLTLKKTL